MEKFDYDAGQRGMGAYLFTGWVLASQVLGLLAIILVAVWMGHFRGGFDWQDTENVSLKEFNYHPLFMIIGMVFLYGDAILVYRVFRNDRKIYVKILHAVLHVFALLFAAVGLKAVFDSHNLRTEANGGPIPNMYSLHSWLGLGTVLLFCSQWVCGFVSFLLPGLSLERRASYLPTHVLAGVVIFVLSIATCLMGITEKAFFALPNTYSTFPAEGILINCLGLTLVVLGVIVVYIVTNSAFARQPLPEEQHLQLDD